MNAVMPIEILDTFYDEIKYPHFVKDDNFITLITEHERKMVGQISYRPLPSFQGWAQSLQDNQLESNDQYKIQNWSSALFAFWNSTLSARALQGNEAEICRGVDLMVQLAFQLRLEADHIVRMEKDLPLPGSPGKGHC
ncbi:hypothetical protein BC826DRAFT_1192585 [Russula brevipes]|nr:hypothetical protein BC826DRAFT_1192585 [Russula brevipes]